MADVAGEVVVAITAATDGFNAALAAVAQSLEDAAPALGKLSAVVGAAIAAGLAASVSAYADAERSATSLAVALRNSGQASRETLEDMLAYADSLALASRFSHYEVEAAMAMLATQGLQGDVLKRATQATIDLGTQTGNLTTAARLLGNAYEGAGTGLRRYGIVLQQGTPSALMFSEALAQIEQKFGGRAKADAEALGGSIADLSKILKEFAEHIGGALAQAIKDTAGYLMDHKDELLRFGDDLGDKIVDVLNHLIDFVNFVSKHETLLKGLMGGAALGAVGGAFLGGSAGGAAGGPTGLLAGLFMGGVGGGMAGGLAGLLGADMWEGVTGKAGGSGGLNIPQVGHSRRAGAAGMARSVGSGGAAAPAMAPDEFLTSWKDAYNKLLGIETDGSGKITNSVQNMTRRLLTVFKGFQNALGGGINQFLQGILLNSENLGQALMHIGSSLLNFMLSTISQMAAEWITKHLLMMAASILFNKTVSTDAAAASIIQVATVKGAAEAELPALLGLTYAGLTAAWAPIPPPAGEIGLAAAINVANTEFAGYSSLVALATGGIVNGPTIANLGEGGKREAVVPLETGSGQRALATALEAAGAGGGSVHVTIQGTFLEANPAAWERMIRQQLVPALERSGRKTKRTQGKIW